jgi:UDP-N-acetylmuramate: L-alanyl-gamma-D-glutamyl-meso-diaminopimelate ligase
VRTVPGNGLVVSNGDDANLERVLERGCWTPIERFGTDWQAVEVDANGSFTVLHQNKSQGRVQWDLLGAHNRMNALATIAAARHVGVSPEISIAGLGKFQNVKRRMETRGVVNGITVYDDFAHHPTAIATTIEGLRAKVGKARILAVLEPRSNTMKLGAVKDALPGSLSDADLTFCYAANLGWDAATTLLPLGNKASTHENLEPMIEAIATQAKTGDHVLIMSNGGFGGIHDKLLKRLAA